MILNRKVSGKTEISGPIKNQRLLTEMMDGMVSCYLNAGDKLNFVSSLREKIGEHPKPQRPILSHLFNLMEAIVKGEDKKIDEEVVHLLPKSVLHVHLDGSMDTDVVGESARLRAPGSEVGAVTDFPAFLKDGFQEPLTHMQTVEGIQDAAYRCAIESFKLGDMHAEIRFSPMLHRDKGLGYPEILQAVVTGLEKAHKETGISLSMISAMYRDKEVIEGKVHSVETAESLVAFAKTYKGTIGLGFDLVGLERLNSHPGETSGEKAKREALNAQLSLENPVFIRGVELVKAHNLRKEGAPIGITLHAGEVPGSGKNVARAINLGATRIGHGIYRELEEVDPGLLENIVYEVCPISNLHIGNVRDWASHPVAEMVKAGLKVSISPDNRTVSAVTEADELRFLSKIGSEEGIGVDFSVRREGQVNAQMMTFQEAAMDGAFVSEGQRTLVKGLMQDRLGVLNKLLVNGVSKRGG